MQVDVQQKPALRAAGVRHIGPYMRINEAFARLDAIAGAVPEQLRTEICVPVE